MRKSPQKRDFFQKGHELSSLQARDKIFSNKFMQVILIYQNVHTEPSKPYTGLDYMIRSMSLLQIVRHAEDAR